MTVEQETNETRVLVVLTQMHGSGHLISRAVDLAALTEGGVVYALYLVDLDRAEHIGACLTSRGFVGTAMAQSVKQVASESAQQCAEDALADVRAAAAERGVHCETELVRGRLVETVAQVARRRRPKHVLVCRSKVGLFARLFGKRDLKKLQRELGAALELVDPVMTGA